MGGPGWWSAPRCSPLFRIVEVPAGTSIVEFRYAPASVRLGLVISVLALAGVALLWWAPARRPPSPPLQGA